MEIYSKVHRGQTLGSAEGPIEFNEDGIADVSEEIAKVLIDNRQAMSVEDADPKTLKNSQGQKARAEKTAKKAAANKAAAEAGEGQEEEDEESQDDDNDANDGGAHTYTKSELKGIDKAQLVDAIAVGDFGLDRADFEDEESRDGLIRKDDIVNAIYAAQDEA